MAAINNHKASPILAAVISVGTLHLRSYVLARVPGFVIWMLDHLHGLALVEQGV